LDFFSVMASQLKTLKKLLPQCRTIKRSQSLLTMVDPYKAGRISLWLKTLPLQLSA